MRFGAFSFGSIQIDDVTDDHDVVIDRGEVSQAEENALQEISESNTPVSAGEDIPWKCWRLAIGTGAYGSLPVMKETQSCDARLQASLVHAPDRPGDRGVQREC